MMNNPMNIMQMMSMLKNGGNPKDIAMQLLGGQAINNPIINNAIELANCKDEAGLKRMVENICSERGIDLNMLMKMMK